ncbi:hypothetical protein ACFL2Q_18645 [Thermodesulfobacteriota bacterium]
METQIVEKVFAQLKDLPEESQRQVPQFARSLGRSTPQGTPGKKLLRFAGAIPRDDLGLMREAIEQGCEQVDTAQW